MKSKKKEVKKSSNSKVIIITTISILLILLIITITIISTLTIPFLKDIQDELNPTLIEAKPHYTRCRPDNFAEKRYLELHKTSNNKEEVKQDYIQIISKCNLKQHDKEQCERVHFSFKDESTTYDCTWKPSNN